MKNNILYLLLVEDNEINRQFFKHIEGIARRLEIKIAPVHRHLPSDICHVSHAAPAVEGLGPIGVDVQTPREYIVRDSLVDRAALLAMIIRLSAVQFK